MEHERIRVIIVDDHQMVRETWRLLLESHQSINVVSECASGHEAVDTACTLDPEVILMDINMSPMNGFEATQRILEAAPHIRIIGMSVNNQPGYARNMLRLGAMGYVTKNSTRDEMITAIHEVMQGRVYVCEEVMRRMK